MQERTLLALTAALMGSAALMPVSAFGAALPTCSELATNAAYQLAGNSYVVSPTASIVAATAKNAAYCNVQFEMSSKSGPAYGYATGESQTIHIGIGLPLNSTDGGTGGVQGAWNGKVENLGETGNAGSVGATTTATNSGYVGSSNDTGHTTTQTGTLGNWGVIQATHQLDVGKINDFIYEGIHQQYVWALALAKHYYGQNVTRNYWNGCSTGGRQALALAEKWGTDFDGILAGAPAVFWQEWTLTEAWPALVNRDDVVGAGHTAITTAQYNNAVAHAISACDVLGTDTVADGVVDDPRQCTYSAAADATLISAPTGTCAGANCVDSVQAAAIDKIWDGPSNHDGQRIWHPWQKVVVIGGGGPSFISIGPTIPPGSIAAGQAMAWNHKDLTFSAQNLYSSRAAASANAQSEPSPIALEDEMLLGDSTGGPGNLTETKDFQGIINNVYNGPKHGKIIMWQGAADPAIYWQDSVEIYRQVATLFGSGTTDFAGLQSWFRYYHAPGVAHCGSGVGATPSFTLPDGQSQLFDDLVNWVENGVVPQSAGDSTHIGILATGPGSFGTRPVCPWPTTAIYSGSGATNVASSYTCGGNLDANVALLCPALHTVYGEEASNSLDYAAQGLTAAQCPKP